jgi:hypothetical protein
MGVGSFKPITAGNGKASAIVERSTGTGPVEVIMNRSIPT